jgi:hypothetical protein
LFYVNSYMNKTKTKTKTKQKRKREGYWIKNFRITKRNLGLYDTVEIFQLSFILFLCALLGAFIITSIFTEIDDVLETIKIKHNISYSGFVILKFIETFIQLAFTAVFYYYIEKTIYFFPSLANKLNHKHVANKSANFAIHIVLIVMLLEMNSSLINGLHFIANYITIPEQPAALH